MVDFPDSPLWPGGALKIPHKKTQPPTFPNSPEILKISRRLDRSGR
jgi:hypothetical protein